MLESAGAMRLPWLQDFDCGERRTFTARWRASRAAAALDDGEPPDHGRGRLDLRRDRRDGLFDFFGPKSATVLVPVQERSGIEPGIELEDEVGRRYPTRTRSRRQHPASTSSSTQGSSSAQAPGHAERGDHESQRRIDRLGERVDRLQQLLSLAVAFGLATFVASERCA